MNKNFKHQITVATVVYNGERNIEQTILSIINQSRKNIEYIIVDGGSTDNTLKIIDKYRPTINKVISEPDDGIYNAMNKALTHATGEWIIFINADDYFNSTTTLEKINLDNADFVYGDVYMEDGSYQVRSGKEVNHKSLLLSGISHQATLVKTDLLKSFGGFDERYKIAADYDFFVKIFKSEVIKKYINLPIAVMRMGGVSNSAYKTSLNEKLQVIRNHYDTTNYIRAILYQFTYERPRNFLRTRFHGTLILKYWRNLRDL